MLTIEHEIILDGVFVSSSIIFFIYMADDMSISHIHFYKLSDILITYVDCRRVKAVADI